VTQVPVALLSVTVPLLRPCSLARFFSFSLSRPHLVAVSCLLSLALSLSMHPILLATRDIQFVAPWRGCDRQCIVIVRRAGICVDLLCGRCRFAMSTSGCAFLQCLLLQVCVAVHLCVLLRALCVCARAVVCLPLDFTMAASRARALLSRTRIALAMREKQLLIFFWRCRLVSPLLSESLFVIHIECTEYAKTERFVCVCVCVYVRA